VNLKKNANLVEALGSSLRSGDHGLKVVPGLVKRVLAEDAWRSFVTQRGELVEYDHFEQFVATPPLKGLGASLDLVRTLVRSDPVALDLFDSATRGQQGRRTDLLDNMQEVGNNAPTGTSREAGLRRLRKDRPDLHAEVLAGALSTHAAMLKAGFRQRKVSIPVATPAAAAKALRKNLEPDQIKELVKLLIDD
jgi:hypothetical protein